MRAKSYYIKQQRDLYGIRKAHPDVYDKITSVGYQGRDAEQRLKRDIGRANLTRLKDRVIIAQNSFGVTGVNMDGIKETAEVKEYIKNLEESGIATKGAGSLKLVHPKIYRRY